VSHLPDISTGQLTTHALIESSDLQRRSGSCHESQLCATDRRGQDLQMRDRDRRPYWQQAEGLPAHLDPLLTGSGQREFAF
jgi:hypothetical protein